MKKSLIAIAALAAAGAASAQSSVTLYGVADVGVGYQEVKANGVKVKTTGVSGGGTAIGGLNGSRIGVKGAEDLGNGLKAVFNYEAGFAPNDGTLGSNGATGPGFGRRAVAGLQGSFGSVLLGRDYTPVYNLMTASTADGQSDFDTTTTTKGAPKSPTFTARVNGVHYAGNFSGVGVQAFGTYAKQSIDGAENVNFKGYGLGLSYANGPFMVGAAGQQFKGKDFVGGPGVGQKQTEWMVGGSYDFVAAKLFANYTNFKYAAGDKWQQANVGVSVPFGAASLVAEYGRNRYTGVNGFKTSGNDFMVGANYAFSKRTDVYVRVAQQDDLKNVNGSGYGQNVRKAAVGLRHKF